MCSFSPVRTPKLQLAAEQPSVGECWIPPNKGNPHPRAQEKSQQYGRRGEITFRIKPHTCQRRLEGSNRTLCAPGPTEHVAKTLLEEVTISPESCQADDRQMQNNYTKEILALLRKF